MTFLLFCRSRRPNRKKASQMISQTPSGTLPGTLQEAEIDPLFAPRAFQGRQDDFFGTPRAVRLAARSGSRAAQRPPGSHFGAMLEPFWSHVGTILASIFDPPALHFGTSVVTSFRHVCSLCFSSFYSALRSNQAATKQARQASQASQASKQAKQAFFCRQPLATKRLASSCSPQSTKQSAGRDLNSSTAPA